MSRPVCFAEIENSRHDMSRPEPAREVATSAEVATSGGCLPSDSD